MEEIVGLYLFFGGVVCAVAGGYIASQKNRSAEAWAFICFFTSIIGIIAIAAVPALPQERKSHLKKEITEENLTKEFPQAKAHFSQPVLRNWSWWDGPEWVGNTSFIIIDFERKQIVLGRCIGKSIEIPDQQPYRSSFAFSDIVKAEIIRDGGQVVATNHGNQVFDGANTITVHITVDDVNKPAHEITFYVATKEEGGKQGDLDFDRAVQKVIEFCAYLDSAMQETGEGQSQRAEGGQVTPVSEQISQLWRLKQEGALTQEEFEKQKARLLKS